MAVKGCGQPGSEAHTRLTLGFGNKQVLFKEEERAEEGRMGNSVFAGFRRQEGEPLV